MLWIENGIGPGILVEIAPSAPKVSRVDAEIRGISSVPIDAIPIPDCGEPEGQQLFTYDLNSAELWVFPTRLPSVSARTQITDADSRP